MAAGVPEGWRSITPRLVADDADQLVKFLKNAFGAIGESPADGPAQLRPIEGTALEYVVNSATPILRVTPTSYYALRAGVWFSATSLAGPWSAGRGGEHRGAGTPTALRYGGDGDRYFPRQLDNGGGAGRGGVRCRGSGPASVECRARGDGAD